MDAQRYPGLERQCRKMMYAFYDYFPMHYKNVSERDWSVRRLVWDFKDGRAFKFVAEITAKALIKVFGNDVKNIVFACVPASSEKKNELRYKQFSKMVCELTGAENAYSHIKIDGERLAIHEKHDKKSLQSVQIIEFDKDFFKGKKVLIFDDILTRGFSYAKFANQIEKLGAEVLGGFFLGRTMIN